VYKSILIPLDGSEYAAQAVSQLQNVAENGAKVTFVRVIPTVEEFSSSSFSQDVELSPDVVARDAYEREKAAAQRMLANIRQDASVRGYDIHTELAEGAPAEEVLEAAQSAGADLILMSAYGLSASSTPRPAGVFGSVADAILKSARQPVLIVKPGSA
jgi:nucleotide-binding universal stress UspA family protein